jgi:Ulp1 family protease
VDALTKLGTVDPSVIQLGGDILASNVNGPGMELIAKRKRRQLFTSGVLSPDELTEEEQQEMQANQQQPQPDPAMVLAQAEQAKAQAELANAQTKQAEAELDKQVKIKEAEQKDKELQIRAYEAETKRFEADIDRAKALGEIKGKAALSAKLLAEAQAQDIENDAVMSGITSIVDRLRG